MPYQTGKLHCFLMSLMLFGRMIAAHPVVEGTSNLLGSRISRPNASDLVFGDANSTGGDGNDGNVLNFQVSAPVLIPPGVSKDCVVTLVEHAFANSYYQPFVGSYKPPPCKFDRVVLNFTLHTFGKQYDRMGTLFLGDHEIFRHTTAEPGGKNIAYTHWKEVDTYLTLWKKEQRVILDIPNIVEGPYTGILYVTLTAIFYEAANSDKRATADQILPISNKASGERRASTFKIPRDTAHVSYKFPSNISRAVVGIAATGQQNEEFWYKNALTSDHKKPKFFENTNSHSPYREIQLMIDGQLAGVVQPFPGIFTNGINPAFWRPMVGIDAFDLRQYQIEITPFLGILCDGEEHKFEIRVCGLEDDGAGHATVGPVGWYWVVSGNIFLFSGSSDATKWVSKPIVHTPDPEISISSKDEAGTLKWNVDLQRKLEITASLKSNTTRKIVWQQYEIFKTQNTLIGSSGTVTYWTNGYRRSKPAPYVNQDAFSLKATWAYERTPQGLSIDGTFDQMQSLYTVGPSIFPTGVQDPSFGGIKSKCPQPTDYKSWPWTAWIPQKLYPIASQLIFHSGKATYGEKEAEEADEGLKNNVKQNFHLSGTCFPLWGDGAIPINSNVTKLIAAQQNAQQVIETYDRHLEIVNENITRGWEWLRMADKEVPIPSIGGILDWRRPTTPSLSDTPNSGQTTQPIGSDAYLQAILGIGIGEVGPGYQTQPGDHTGNSTGTAEPGIQPTSSISSTGNNVVAPVGTY